MYCPACGKRAQDGAFACAGCALIAWAAVSIYERTRAAKANLGSGIQIR